MSEENKKTSEENDFLSQYLSENDYQTNDNSDDKSSDDAFNNNIKSDAVGRAGDLDFFNFDMEMLPYGIFYPKGTKLMVRPASVKEIQAYSMVDDNNPADVIEKMNDMIASCVRIKNQDGTMSSYMDLFEGDRYYIIFLIREITFQKGNSLAVNTECECGKKLKIELKRQFFEFFEMDPVIEPYFNYSDGSFYFETINNKTFRIAPPKIGIQKAFTDYIMKEVRANANSKKKVNMSFLKVVPFQLAGRNHISEEGIKKYLMEYENMGESGKNEDFQFLNSCVDKMKFGIKNLKMECPDCHLDVREKMQFPGGASAIFVDENAFEKYLKK